MKKTIKITTHDYNRLIGLIEFATLRNKMPDVVTRLYNNLINATMLPQENIDEGIITMNSRVKLRDLKNERETEITITYPKDADPSDRRISVLSEIGTALLGRAERDVVSWKVPNGTGLFEIVKVTYQPEAAGHFYL